MYFRKRSLSPLIATILLIVVSVILITVILTWGSSFVRDNLNQVTDLYSFQEDKDLKGFIVVNSLTQSESNNTLILKNTSKFDLNVIGYSLLSNDSNYVFLNKYFYLENPLFLSSGSITSLSLVCIPSNKLSIQIITDQNTFVEVPFFTNNLNQEAYCLGRDDLVGYWSFDEGDGTTAFDSSGSNYNGAIYNGEYADGVSGSALNFNGIDSHVDLGSFSSTPKLQMGYGSITVEHWIKPPEWEPNYMQIFGVAGGGAKGYGTTLSSNGINFRHEIYGEVGGRQETSVNINIVKNEWNHIVTVFDRSNIKVYNNGVLKNTRNIADPGDVQSTTNFRIGRYSSGAWFFLGSIDEVRVFNRSLTEEEVNILYRLR